MRKVLSSARRERRIASLPAGSMDKTDAAGGPDGNWRFNPGVAQKLPKLPIKTLMFVEKSDNAF